jgi:hypothetical protein
VATEASVRNINLIGLNVTGNPITVLVGVPSSTVLISTFTGAFPLSFLAKNKSTQLKMHRLHRHLMM